MKKLLPVILLLLIVVAGCNKEKTYTENLQGEWDLYKYLQYNVDRTTLYDAQYNGYKITFDGTNFIELVDSTNNKTVEGTFAFEDNEEKLVLTNIANTYTPVTDSLGAVVDSIAVPFTRVRKYTIFNLTRDHVQLRNDTSQLYLRKLAE